MARKPRKAGHDGPPLCGANKKQGPGTCTQVAGWGTPNTTGPCKLHGGATRNHKTRAAREEARLACELFGLEMDDRDPAVVLIDEITRTRRSIAWHETEIALALNAEDVELADRRLSGWSRERRHLADVTAKALHAGVALRSIELAEGTARQVVQVMAAFAARLGFDPADPRVREAGREALQLVEGGGG